MAKSTANLDVMRVSYQLPDLPADFYLPCKDIVVPLLKNNGFQYILRRDLLFYLCDSI